MLNIAKYAAVAAVAVCLGVTGTKPAAAWDYGYGHGYGPMPIASHTPPMAPMATGSPTGTASIPTRSLDILSAWDRPVTALAHAHRTGRVVTSTARSFRLWHPGGGKPTPRHPARKRKLEPKWKGRGRLPEGTVHNGTAKLLNLVSEQLKQLSDLIVRVHGSWAGENLLAALYALPPSFLILRKAMLFRKV